MPGPTHFSVLHPTGSQQSRSPNTQPIAKPPRPEPPKQAAPKPAPDASASGAQGSADASNVAKRDKSKKKMSDEEVVRRLREIVSPENPKDRYTSLEKIGQG
jgi:hypothetical protein